jgi:hypothetical protein
MKYVSLIFLIGVVAATWLVAKNDPGVSEASHLEIQKDLQRVITELIQQNAPEVTDIRFEKFWTQTLTSKQIKAVFAYSFNEGAEGTERSARIGIEGHAILNRMVDQSGMFELWGMDSLFIENNRIDFKEGLNIQPSGSTNP